MNLTQFTSKYRVSPAALLDLSKRIRSVKLSKGSYFINYEEKMNKIGVLLDGILVSRYSTEDGKEITSKFYYPQGNIIVVDYYCFKTYVSRILK